MYLQRLFLLLAALCCFGTASAQTPPGWPSKPIVLFFPYAVGALDIPIRFYTTAVNANTGWNFVIEPRPGANGSLAASQVYKAPPDGHQLFVSSGTLALGDIMEVKPPYDGLKDFTPVYQMTNTTQIVVVHPSLPIRTMQEYVAYARANPGKINWSMTGSAGIQRLVGELLHRQAGVQITFVPYKGTPVMVPDLISGQLQATLQSPRVLAPLITSGKVRAIAVSLAKGRSVSFPDITSVAEQGLPDFSYSAWTGLHAKTGTPASIVNALNGEFNKVAKTTDFRAKFDSIGEGIGGGTVEEFRAFQLSQRERWVGIANVLGMKLAGD